MARPTERSRQPVTVLVVSGSPTFEGTATRLLTEAGFVPACAFEWEAARLSLTRTQPQVVLVDGTATGAHVAAVAAEAAARGIPLLIAGRGSDPDPGLEAAAARAGRSERVPLPLAGDALQAALGALLASPATDAQPGAEPRGDGPAAAPAADMARRRDSLTETLREIETGALTGVGVIVVSRGWWDELHLGERTALRRRCEEAGVALRADDRLSRHYVELGPRPVGAPLSSEREI